MSLLLTYGLGSIGDGTASTGLVTQGLGSTGDPITGPEYALRIYTIENLGLSLRVVFSNLLDVNGDALDPDSWVIEAVDNGRPVEVTDVDVSGSVITLTISEQTLDAIYTLNVPETNIMDINGVLNTGDLSWEFVGFGTLPTLPICRSTDAHELEAVFSEPVMEEDALDPDNYVLSGGLSVTSVTKQNDQLYTLTTTRQTPGVTYTIDAINIRDLAGNETE